MYWLLVNKYLLYIRIMVEPKHKFIEYKGFKAETGVVMKSPWASDCVVYLNSELCHMKSEELRSGGDFIEDFTDETWMRITIQNIYIQLFKNKVDEHLKRQTQI